MRRFLVVAGAVIVGQFNMQTWKVSRCWVLEGTATVTATTPGPFYLSRDAGLGGWMIWAPVLHGDLDAAARTMGFKSAKDCGS